MKGMEQLLENCMLCPRRCGINRIAGERGFCGAGKEILLARAALHHWEEPCLSGERGSGAVFFAHCTLRCCYCQNYKISAGGCGKVVSVEALCAVFLELQRQGAHNLNWITATHYLPQVLEAWHTARARGLTLPVVYNCGGYESVETLRVLDGVVDVYLPDFKYADAASGEALSQAHDYPAVALQAIAEMGRQTGAAQFDEKGMMTRGVLVRHLLLPDHVEESKRALELLWNQFGDQIWISIMNQYTPVRGTAFPALNRAVDPLDYRDLVSYARFIGIRQGFVQEEGTVAESFVPRWFGEEQEKEGVPRFH